MSLTSTLLFMIVSGIFYLIAFYDWIKTRKSSVRWGFYTMGAITMAAQHLTAHFYTGSNIYFFVYPIDILSLFLGIRGLIYLQRDKNSIQI